MKKAIYQLLILISIFILGCQKKKYPDPVEARENTFYAKLLLDGQALDLETGKDNYYMYCSYEMDSSNVYNLIGEFKQAGCTTCGNSLRIQVNAPAVSIPNSVLNVDSVLKVKPYEYLSGANGLGYEIKFTGSFSNKQISTIKWDFGDGGTSSELSPTHVFKPGKYKVTLMITSTDKNQSTLTNTISVNTTSDVNAYVSAIATDSTVYFNAKASGGFTPYKFTWDFGDGTTGTGASPTHIYTTRGSYGVTLKVSDSRSNTKTCYYNTFTHDDVSACATNFAFSSPTYIGQRLGSKVSIRYTDAKGVIFTSDNAGQPGNSSFDILSVDDFTRNENGQLVKKVKMKFNCKLYNGSQSVTLQGAEVIAGFAYK